MAEIIKGNGNDTINGTQEADIIRAGGGNDFVFGKAGSDDIFADSDNDELPSSPTLLPGEKGARTLIPCPFEGGRGRGQI